MRAHIVSLPMWIILLNRNRAGKWKWLQMHLMLMITNQAAYYAIDINESIIRTISDTYIPSDIVITALLALRYTEIIVWFTTSRLNTWPHHQLQLQHFFGHQWNQSHSSHTISGVFWGPGCRTDCQPYSWQDDIDTRSEMFPVQRLWSPSLLVIFNESD